MTAAAQQGHGPVGQIVDRLSRVTEAEDLTLRDLFEEFGESSFLPALMSLFLCFTGTVACATVIGELGTDLVAGVMHTSYDSVSQTSVLAAFSVGILTPLCLLPCALVAPRPLCHPSRCRRRTPGGVLGIGCP